MALADNPPVSEELEPRTAGFPMKLYVVHNFADDSISTSKRLCFINFFLLFIHNSSHFKKLKLPSFKYWSLPISKGTSLDLLQYNLFFTVNRCPLWWWMVHQSHGFALLLACWNRLVRHLPRDITSWLIWLKHWGLWISEPSNQKSTSHQRDAV